jgi:hypothetical protein
MVCCMLRRWWCVCYAHGVWCMLYLRCGIRYTDGMSRVLCQRYAAAATAALYEEKPKSHSLSTTYLTNQAI